MTDRQRLDPGPEHRRHGAGRTPETVPPPSSETIPPSAATVLRIVLQHQDRLTSISGLVLPIFLVVGAFIALVANSRAADGTLLPDLVGLGLLAWLGLISLVRWWRLLLLGEPAEGPFLDLLGPIHWGVCFRLAHALLLATGAGIFTIVLMTMMVAPFGVVLLSSITAAGSLSGKITLIAMALAVYGPGAGIFLFVVSRLALAATAWAVDRHLSIADAWTDSEPFGWRLAWTSALVALPPILIGIVLQSLIGPSTEALAVLARFLAGTLVAIMLTAVTAVTSALTYQRLYGSPRNEESLPPVRSDR